MTVTHLLIKSARRDPLVPVSSMHCAVDLGIHGGVKTPPLRQVLLVPEETIGHFQLTPGDLRENVVVRMLGLHALPSGTVLKLGSVEVRLTFHCEPCKRVKDLGTPRQLLHRRGYLGQFLSSGAMRVGDDVKILDKVYPCIPYDIVERVRWYLDQSNAATFRSVDLLHSVGLSKSYARALPRLLAKLPNEYRSRVIFKSKPPE